MANQIPKHFSDLIRDQFHTRALKNPAYSLRAFARDIGLSSGGLSDILTKKSGLSESKAQLIAEKIFNNQEERNFFCKLVKANCARNEEEKKEAESQLWNFDTEYTTLSDKYYCVLSEWYHFALVELVKVKEFKNDPQWISQRLGISPEEVKKAIERLLHVRLLSLVEGELIQTYDFFSSPSGTPSDAAKKFHKQILSKAAEAIMTQRIEDRDFSSGFLRVRKNEIPLIGQKIKEFKRELSKEIESGEGHDSVYAFSIQFFRADQDEIC